MCVLVDITKIGNCKEKCCDYFTDKKNQFTDDSWIMRLWRGEKIKKKMCWNISSRHILVPAFISAFIR